MKVRMGRNILVLVLLAVVFSALPAMAAKEPVDFKQDHVKMQWWLVDYGTKDNAPFAVVRKYYTNETIKRETIDLLMSKFGLSPESAGSLYFTEYMYEYTPDGKQFAVVYQRHYDMLGEEIHGTVFDGKTENTKKTFAAIDAKHATGKSVAYVFPKAPAKAPAKKK